MTLKNFIFVAKQFYFKQLILFLSVGVFSLLLSLFDAQAEFTSSCRETANYRRVYCQDLVQTQFAKSNLELVREANSCSEKNNCWCRFATEKDKMAFPRESYTADPSFLKIAKFETDKNRTCTDVRFVKGECAPDILAIEKKSKIRIASVCKNTSGKRQGPFEESFYVGHSLRLKTTRNLPPPPSKKAQFLAKNTEAQWLPYGTTKTASITVSVGPVVGGGILTLLEIPREQKFRLLFRRLYGSLTGASLGACLVGSLGMVMGSECSQFHEWAFTSCGGATVESFYGAGVGGCVATPLEVGPVDSIHENLEKLKSELSELVYAIKSKRKFSSPSGFKNCLTVTVYGEACVGFGGSLGMAGFTQSVVLMEGKLHTPEHHSSQIILGI